ncbi:MAG: FKBP-type peptidyl-prolyl cis-trans isomerase, partial [archaeon]|nr:FKBP-type peptidyl-prolyl cis-trans isomerase [archaeon]
MPLEMGSLVYVNYIAKIKDTNEVIEVTIEDEAKKLGVHDPSRKYEPRLIAIGEGWVLKGLDEALASTNVGDK